MRPGREVGLWLDGQERADRKNARVIDKLEVALPIDLTPEQRTDLVCDFAAETGGGKVPWLAAIHDKGMEEPNPHCHPILRQRLLALFANGGECFGVRSRVMTRRCALRAGTQDLSAYWSRK